MSAEPLRSPIDGVSKMLCRLNVPLKKPDDIIPHLAKREAHWADERSAKELAICWSNAGNDFPPAVKRLLISSPDFHKAELVDGIFEREVDLGTAGRNSQTDLMVVIGIEEKLGVIAVEGKVDEPFGDLVSEWNDSSDGKIKRLTALCSTLGLNPNNVNHLRYQLLHRTVSAVYEAKRYRSDQALMLVHTFSPTNKWYSDFVTFADVMGLSFDSPEGISSSKHCEGVDIRLAWVKDEFPKREFPKRISG
jgi:hypothetical protein